LREQNRAVLQLKIQPTTLISETEKKKEHLVSMHDMHVRNIKKTN